MRQLHFAKILLILLPLYCLFTNCGSNIQHKLYTIDTLLEKDSLDAASTLFKKIKGEELLNADDSAYYYLLSTEIDWQKYIPFDNDSNINYSITYYKKTNNKPKLARSYHYKSGILFCLGRKKEAIIFEKEAELLSKKINDDLLKYIIYNNLTNFNDDAGNHAEAINYSKKRLFLANKTKNNEWKAYTLCDIAAIKVVEREYDSAMYYIEKILPIINHISTDDQYYIWTNMGKCLADLHPNKAIQLYKKALETSHDPKIYGFIANLYYKQKQGEKAMPLWEIALNDSNIRFRISVLEAQHKYLSEQDREHEAHQVAERIIVLKDSLDLIQRQDSIREIQEMLDRKYIEQEAREEKHLLLAACSILSLLIAIVTAIYFICRHHYQLKIRQHEKEALNNKKEIEKLRETTKQNSTIMRRLQKEIELQRTKHLKQLAEGKRRYDEIMQGGNTLKWHKHDVTNFMEYYRMVDNPFVEKFEKQYNTMPSRLIIYEVLCHLGYTKQEIAERLCIAEDTLRSYKSRVKSHEQAHNNIKIG